MSLIRWPETSDPMWIVVDIIRKGICAIPVYMVFGLICIDWYIYNVTFSSIKAHENYVVYYVSLASFNTFMGLLIVSYLRAVFTSSAVVDYPLPQSAANHRKCRKCQEIKSPRTHHCSVCGKCILKMDHHCPWVANCVGLHNYKYFFLFVMYAELCAIVFLIRGFDVIKSLLSGDSKSCGGDSGVKCKDAISHGFATVFATIITASFALTLLYFLGFHVYLVLNNRSTLEMNTTRENPYDNGYKKNWEAVFGDNPWLWFMPVPTCDEDGHHYPPLYLPTDEIRINVMQTFSSDDEEDEDVNENGHLLSS